MGVPRCGNHPIIKLICANSGPRGFIHFNLCKPLQDPVTAHLNVETRDGLLRPSKADEAIKLKQVWDVNAYDVVIFSYEDLFLDAHHALENQISGPFEDRIDHNLFITRSLPNWMASWMQQRLRKLANTPDALFNLEKNPHFVVEKVIRVFRNWLTHLRAVDAALLAGGTDGNVGAVFDQFYNDPLHRAQILNQLELAQVTLDLPDLTVHGGGSSFSGVKVQDVTQLGVQDRWSYFKDNPYFVLLLRLFWQDDEVRTLCNRHFPQSSIELDEFLMNASDTSFAQAG